MHVCRSPCLLPALVVVAVAITGCSPEVLIARSDPPGAGGVAGSGTAGTATAGTATAGTGELPIGGEGGAPPVVVEPARILADSVADFSLTQGEHGWWYGYDTGTYDSFALMTKSSVITAYMPASNDVWKCWANDTAQWTQLFELGGHPNGLITSSDDNMVLERAVRRWVSTYAGDVLITGELAKIDTAAPGNGVEGSVYIDGESRFSKTIAADDAAGESYEATGTVQVGSTVDFVLDPLESDDRHDLSRFTGIITRIERATAE
jgi:hypothetical protein